MVHTYATSRIDNGNCLLYGISHHLLIRLQRVQHAAARLITRTKRRDHITAGLIDQTTDRVQTATFDVSKPSQPSCIILSRPTNSLPADPCATLRGGSTMRVTYAGVTSSNNPLPSHKVRIK